MSENTSQLVHRATPEETAIITQGLPATDFIDGYAQYADVLEAPRQMHEAVATQLLATVLNQHVYIPYGALKISLDLWVLLLSPSGMGRNTLVELARPVLEGADLTSVLRNTTWGSKQAFYQHIAEHSTGLFVWSELAAVLKNLSDARFAGVKEWLTDRYDNWNKPPTIGYRETGKKADTPPIVFQEAPRLNILATSSFEWFIGNLTQEDTTGGFIPRWALIRVEEPTRVIPKPRDLNSTLVQPLAEHLRRASNLRGVADLSLVEDTYAQWYVQARLRFWQQPNRALAMPFFSRMRALVLKLAVVYQVSQSVNLQVSPVAMQRAIDTACIAEQTIFPLLLTGMSREGSEVDKMAERVKQAGAEGLLRSELTSTFQYVKAPEREGRLRTLVQAGTVKTFSRKTSGRPAQVLVHKDYLEEHAQKHPEDQEANWK